MLNPFRIAAVPVLSLIAGVFLWGAESPGGVVDGTNWVLLGWNNLGMHCMDDDYSVFSILPPFNTVNAQLLWSRNGTTRLVTNGAGAFVVTYEAVADLDGSRNTTAIGKTEFWSYEHQMYGADLPPDTGLTGMSMPGAANVPQAMVWETDSAWFAGNGIPITPWDDRGLKNPYPMMRLRAKRASDGVELASLDVVLPVSDEMDCRACHGSGAGPAAEPSAGWVYDPNASHDCCYACHNGIDSSSPGPNQPPIVTNRWLALVADGSNAVSLAGNDPNGNTLSYRVVSQPMYGSVALNTNTGLATYIAEPGYTGPDFFTFTAWDGYVNSTNLAVVSVTVGGVGSLAQDPDGDGLSDLAEYGLGMASRFNSLPGAPRAELIQQGADKFLSLTANRLFVPPDVSMWVEESTNLVDWFSDGAHVVTVSNSATVLKARSATPAQSIPKDFLRLKATRP